MKIAIRVDASLAIGTGHVMRCLSLADALHRQGGDVCFICRPHAGEMGPFIEAHGYQLWRLEAPAAISARQGDLAHAAWLGAGWEADAVETRAVLERCGGVDWLVVDHYAIDARWEKRQRPVAKRILAIDDLADRVHDCDLLLDQNMHADPATRYAGLLPAGCAGLYGPRYALLRQEFADARASLRQRDGTVRRLLVFFGGVDADNLSGRMLDRLARLPAAGIAVDVVMGGSSPHRDAVRRQCEAMAGTTYHQQVEDMARLMAVADLAIGAGGSTTWERCCLGLPSIVVPLADNQVPGLRAIGESGGVFVATETVDPADEAVAAIDAVLGFALKAPAALRHQARQAMRLVDGRGAGRLAKHMGLPALSVRPAVTADGEAIHAWRNDPAIRLQSRNPAPIDPDGHMAWFSRMLVDRHVDLLICERPDGPVGVLRYDRDGPVAEVSIYLVPSRLGSGLGGTVLNAGETWLRSMHPEVTTLQADVLPSNGASHRMFENGGYVPVLQKLEKRLSL